MTGKLNGSGDIEYICLFCYLPRCLAESKWCLYNRYYRLKKSEERARQAGRVWISKRQTKRMLEEIGEHSN